jgi:hypothetical protein
MYTLAQLPQGHGHALVKEITGPERAPRIAVEADESVWSYAASFNLSALASLNGAGEPRVVADLEVEDGEIGVGCTTADYTSYVDREVLVPSGMRRKVYVPIGAPGAASHVMLRNASTHGRSVACVRDLEIRRVTAAEEIQEHLRTSGPIGPAISHGATVVQAFGSHISAPA